MIAIAARIKKRCSVSDRSIRYWTQWAIELGVLQIDVRSQKYGRREWNLYQSTWFESELFAVKLAS